MAYGWAQPSPAVVVAWNNLSGEGLATMQYPTSQVPMTVAAGGLLFWLARRPLKMSVAVNALALRDHFVTTTHITPTSTVPDSAFCFCRDIGVVRMLS